MAGITSLLNIAKTALLTHQLSLQTAGHNVSNVNTEGYSRQEVTLEAQYPNLSPIGNVGNGVTAREITRAYNSFITNTLFSKMSDKAGLETQESAMTTIEGILNEVDGSGLYNQLNEFWSAWDDLSNNAEGIPERMTLLEKAKLLVDGIRERYNSLLNLSNEVNLNLEQTVKDINQTADQIAELNVQIVAMEANGHAANDLRDKRDVLLKKLSELTDLHYFETPRGTYTIIMGKGFQLVEGDRSWHIEYSNGAVNWIGTDGTRTELTQEEVGAGKLGAWLDIKSRISPRDKGLLIGSTANTSGGKAVNSWTRWDEIDGVNITGPFEIHFSGTDQDGLPVTGTFQYDPGPPESGARIQDFLDAIEAAFSGPGKGVQAYVNEDGRISIKDLTPGTKSITFQIDSIQGLVNGLDLGKFDGRYPTNYLETLNQWATALIKEVNTQHSQGAGLAPLTETTGVYSATNTGEPIGFRSSGLFFSDQVKAGSFEIWLFDQNGNVVDYDPSTPEVNDPVVISVDPATTTMEDLKNAVDSIEGISARLVNGHLVIGVDGTTSVAGFAFGKDTSGALLATGLNAFFTGTNAETIGLDQAIQDDPTLIAAAKVESKGTSVVVSQREVIDPQRPLGASIDPGTLTIYKYDQNGLIVGSSEIQVDPAHDSLNEIINRINQIDGVFAEITPTGTLRIYGDSQDFSTIGIGNDTSGLMKYLGIPTANQEIQAFFSVTNDSVPLGSPLSGLSDYGALKAGSFELKTYGPDGALIGESVLNFDPNTMSLQDVANALNGTGLLNASIVDGRLILDAPPGTQGIFFKNDTTNLMSSLGLPTIGQSLTGMYGVEDLNVSLDDIEQSIVPGSFNLYLYDQDGISIPGSPINISVGTWDSLEDIALKLDAISGIKAKVVGGRLDVRAEDGVGSFILTDDTSNLFNTLGIFTPLGGGLSPANNENALSIRDISRYSIDSLNGATINEAYQNLVGRIGIETRGIKTDHEFLKSTVADLQMRRDAISGVSLDEELSNLLKFQHAYTAAAKLISTADELYLALLQAKQ
ncbi:Flagellar hook-associated protein FlgK [Dissulfuribacter thermophilus]|uniref:Flagellar hook-associated protein 1 n=1 Tax=Dissulfuribacter thermophilus TaxID=1156395 RepID=A0A1B9F6H7_9BACT|nr:flagellar hook-associated protein FlgK [Dissulfuribacter thermophilus]OCC15558.1 Flagellar hook-associated protein FlgK [Dissulfuribacter thermophilus]